jgi:hypothetical protein
MFSGDACRQTGCADVRSPDVLTGQFRRLDSNQDKQDSKSCGLPITLRRTAAPAGTAGQGRATTIPSDWREFPAQPGQYPASADIRPPQLAPVGDGARDQDLPRAQYAGLRDRMEPDGVPAFRAGSALGVPVLTKWRKVRCASGNRGRAVRAWAPSRPAAGGQAGPRDCPSRGEPPSLAVSCGGPERAPAGEPPGLACTDIEEPSERERSGSRHHPRRW